MGLRAIRIRKWLCIGDEIFLVHRNVGLKASKNVLAILISFDADTHTVPRSDGIIREKKDA